MIKTFGATGFGPARFTNGITPLSLGKPAAAFPGRVATDADLMIAVDRQQTRLVSPLDSSATSMTVESAAAIGAYNLLSIDSEIVKTTGPPVGNVVPISRGFDGTTPTLHLATAVVSGFIDAYHHNSLVAEVEAIEQALGANLSHVPSISQIVSTNFIFTPQTPGGNLTVGNNVVALSPVPPGVNGTDTGHYLYVSGGVGAAEACLITGGTAVAGAASGTVIISCANTHSGAWTLATATAGIQEALVTNGPAGGVVNIPAGSFTLNGPVNPPASIGKCSAISGSGRFSTVLNVSPTFPLTVQGVFIANPTEPGPNLSGFRLVFTQPDTSVFASFTHYPPAFYARNCPRLEITDVVIEKAWVGLDMAGGTNSGGALLRDVWMSAMSIGLNIDGAQDSVRIRGFHFWPWGLTNNQTTAFLANAVGIQVGAADDIHISDGLFLCFLGVKLIPGTGRNAFGEVIACDFDTGGGLNMAAGTIAMSGCFFSTSSSAANFQAIVQTGGLLTLSSANLQSGVTNTAPLIEVNYNNGSPFGATNIHNCNFFTANSDMNSVLANAAAGSGGTVTLTGNTFYRTPNVAYTKPTISVGSNSLLRANIIGTHTTDKGAGAGVMIAIGQDSNHIVWGNAFLGWTSSYPSARTVGLYQDDNVINFRAITAASLNLILNETGANNAIAGALPGVPLSDGMMITIRLAHSLQAGVNTFAYGGGAPIQIRKHTLPGSPLTTAYVVGSFITLVYDFQQGFFQDMSQ